MKTVSSALCSKATVLLSRVRPWNWTSAMPLSDKCPINTQCYEEHSISNPLKVTRQRLVMELVLLYSGARCIMKNTTFRALSWDCTKAGDFRHFCWLTTKWNLIISIYRHLFVFKLKNRRSWKDSPTAKMSHIMLPATCGLCLTYFFKICIPFTFRFFTTTAHTVNW